MCATTSVREVSNPSPTPALLVVSRFRVTDQARAAFLAAAAAAVDVLAAQTGCRTVALGQSTDDEDLMVIRSEWDGVGAYRRGMSSFDVKVSAVPLLSLAIDEPSAYELVRDRVGGVLTVSDSGLAADAGQVGLGSAAGPDVPSVAS